jgi:hypothetical protein
MRIRPGTHVGRDDAGRVVIGDGDHRRELTCLTRAQLDVIQRLVAGDPLPLPAPGSPEVREYAEVLGHLRPWLEEVDPAQRMPGLAAERLRPDARAWAGVWGGAGKGVRAEEVMLARTRASVWVSALDRTGLATAMTLAAAGVGRIAVPHDGVVVGEDLGTSPLRLTELGLPRSAGLARHLSRLYPYAHVLSPVSMDEALHGVDVAVLSVRHGFTAEHFEAVADTDVPVLPVVLWADGFQVGPAVGLGEPCPQCAAGQWPSLAQDGAEMGHRPRRRPLRPRSWPAWWPRPSS